MNEKIDNAILLLAFGAPDSLKDVEPFLENITSGRKLNPDKIEDIKERYRLIGGGSPLNKITSLQAKALQEMLNNKKKTSKVFIGMRYWEPSIKDTLISIANNGYKNVIAVCMFPYRSDYTFNGYNNDIVSALKNMNQRLNVDLIKEWYNNSRFQETIAKNISKSLSYFKNGKTAVVFSAHSLPKRVMSVNDPYVYQIEETINGVISKIGVPVNWRFGYQSKGLAPGEWLEPSIDSILDQISVEGFHNVLIVPIGFVSDHIETLYDIDICYKGKAEKLGLNFLRTKSLNDSSGFIESLHQIVSDRIYLHKSHLQKSKSITIGCNFPERF